MIIQRVILVCAVFSILALALGLSIGTGFFAKTTSTTLTETQVSEKTIVEIVGSTPSATATIGLQIVGVDVVIETTSSGCSGGYFNVDYFSNSTAYFLPNLVTSEFFGFLTTTTEYYSLYSTITSTYPNTSLVTVNNIQNGSTRILTYTATC